jgi:hypothetical protein
MTQGSIAVGGELGRRHQRLKSISPCSILPKKRSRENKRAKGGGYAAKYRALNDHHYLNISFYDADEKSI